MNIPVEWLNTTFNVPVLNRSRHGVTAGDHGGNDSMRTRIQTSTSNTYSRMKKHPLVLSILIAGAILIPALAVQAGCCGADMSGMAGCFDPAPANVQTPQPPAGTQLPQPVATVFDNYAQIQAALANDSLTNLTERGQAIAKAINDDTAKTFPAAIADQADALAKARDLKTARSAFKSLSMSLVEYSSKNPRVAGVYRTAYCSMANAYWLQTGSTVNNPYFGKSMAHCGQFVASKQ